jgi:hypothetical protein
MSYVFHVTYKITILALSKIAALYNLYERYFSSQNTFHCLMCSMSVHYIIQKH